MRPHEGPMELLLGSLVSLLAALRHLEPPLADQLRVWGVLVRPLGFAGGVGRALGDKSRAKELKFQGKLGVRPMESVVNSSQIVISA